MLSDIEAQEREGRGRRPRRRERAQRKLRWWQDDGGWDGLKGKILALVISGLLLAISLAVCKSSPLYINKHPPSTL